ncbi:MAG: retron system putative HNH endonuclease [Polyangiaceae bacterium]
MIRIHKGKEPAAWVEHRNTPGAAYDGSRGVGPSPEAMRALREALASEQGFLCCYCMQRIQPPDMKVEHFVAQSLERDSTLDYANLLACCRGGEGNRRSEQHCDTHRGNQPLTYNPAKESPDVESRYAYGSDGLMTSHDARASQDIVVLNLNLGRLKDNRRAVIDALVEWANKASGRPRFEAKLKEEEEREPLHVEGMTENERALGEFLGVTRYWLRRHARRP